MFSHEFDFFSEKNLIENYGIIICECGQYEPLKNVGQTICPAQSDDTRGHGGDNRETMVRIEDDHICLMMVDRLPRAGDAGQLSGRRKLHWPSQCLS